VSTRPSYRFRLPTAGLLAIDLIITVAARRPSRHFLTARSVDEYIAVQRAVNRFRNPVLDATLGCQRRHFADNPSFKYEAEMYNRNVTLK